ncbi:Leucine-rich repeat serine/threonine-protein kinase 2 [Tulasnella sp. 403]|nr:Leucine-rich repeat serine/threonine-protein kinase 2 [Tulasnella sp. 403]
MADHIYMVSPWATEGCVQDYVSANPTVDRVKFLYETALALEYMHGLPFVHGDIKAGNVLVSSDKHVLLCDFGLARSATKDTDPLLKGFGSLRWQAPELMDGNPKSTSSDVYAFGMTIFEVLSGKLPFWNYDADSAIMFAVMFQYERPSQEPGFSPLGKSYDWLWNLASKCWATLPNSRPSMIDVVHLFESAPLETASPESIVAYNGGGLDTTSASPTPRGHCSPEHALVPQIDVTAIPRLRLAINGTIRITDKILRRDGLSITLLGSYESHGEIALKRMCGKFTNDAELFMLQAQTWNSLSHPFILRFLGIHTIDHHTYLVSRWTDKGSLLDYLKANPTADRVKFLHEVALALEYMHGLPVVHGDIRAENILVSSDKHALLCDFTLSRFATADTNPSIKGIRYTRWQAPELLRGGVTSVSSDVYAFGMTIFEVLSGRLPFWYYASDTVVAAAVTTEDERPDPDPSSSTSGQSYVPLWSLSSACWATLPNDRPSMSEVVQIVGVALITNPSKANIDPEDARGGSPPNLRTPNAHHTSKSAVTEEIPGPPNHLTNRHGKQVVLGGARRRMSLAFKTSKGMVPPIPKMEWASGRNNSGLGSTQNRSVSQALVLRLVTAGERPSRIPERSAKGAPFSVLWGNAKAFWTQDKIRRSSMDDVISLFNGSGPRSSSQRAMTVRLPSGDVVELDARVPIVLMSNCDIFVGTIHSGTKVALKRLRERDRSKEDVLQQFRLEEEIWRSVRHANILQFMDAATDSTLATYLVSPWQQDGTLWDYIHKNSKCDRSKYIFETAEALEYLHVEAKVIHGDIKAQNILVSKENRALLCDFGISRYLNQASPKALLGAGTRQWQSPELLEGGPTSCQSDVYAFGMTIFQVLSGKEPFGDYLDFHQIKAVLDGVSYREGHCSTTSSISGRSAGSAAQHRSATFHTGV